MSITFVEAADSRQRTHGVNGEGVRLHWHGKGTTLDTAIKAALVALAPTSWDGLTLVNLAENPHQSSGWWDCTADYAASAEQAGGVKLLTEPGVTDPLGPEFEFDISAQQAHITQSLLTVTSRYDSTVGGLNPANLWAVSTAYEVFDSVVAGGNSYVCTTAGTSSGAGSGPTGTGSEIADGSVLWNWVGTAGGTRAVWAAATAYAADDQVDSHGFLYKCTGGGTSAATGDGPEGAGTGIVDGTCTWDYVGPDLDAAAPDFNGAIGVTRDRVCGTDVYVGALEFSVTAQCYPVTLQLLETLLDLVGGFNEATYFNFPPKTLLYLGCTGTPRPGNIWTLKHRFAASKNVRSLRVGSKIVIPFKGGWDFLWAAYADATVTTGTGRTFNVQRPYAAYVEQVCRPGDFSALPIA